MEGLLSVPRHSCPLKTIEEGLERGPEDGVARGGWLACSKTKRYEDWREGRAIKP